VLAVAKTNNKPSKQEKHPGVPGQTTRMFQTRPPGCSGREDPGVFKPLLIDYLFNMGSHAIMRCFVLKDFPRFLREPKLKQQV
jgi:hypothetical protein